MVQMRFLRKSNVTDGGHAPKAYVQYTGVLGHISAVDQNIFSKFGGYVDKV